MSEALSNKEGIYSLPEDICTESLDDALQPEIRVIILESSDAMLGLLKSEIEKDKNIKVVGMARNAHEARKTGKDSKMRLLGGLFFSGYKLHPRIHQTIWL